MILGDIADRISNKKINFILFLAILCIAIFFRFYNTPDRYGFDFDPVRDGLLSAYAAENLKLPLIGPTSGIAPFTFGPWYYYQIILSRILLPVDFAPWIYIGVTSWISVIAMYFIGKTLENEKLGLLLSLLMALSPAELGPITGLSNPNLVPISATLSLLIFVLIFKNKMNLRLIFLWGIVMGIGINNHFQMMGLLVLPAILFFYKKLPWRSILIFSFGMFLTFIPLIYFNVLNQWHTVGGILNYLEISKYSSYTPNRWLIYLKDFWPDFWSYVIGVPKGFGVIILGYTFVISLYLFFKKSIKPVYFLIFLVVAVNFIALRYFPAPRHFYYFIYLHSFIILAVGWIIYHSIQRRIWKLPGLILLIVILFFTLKEDVRRLYSTSEYAFYTDRTENLLKTYPGSEFTVYYCGKDNRNRSHALALFLYNRGVLSTQGIKVGVKGGDCKVTTAIDSKTEWKDAYILNKTETENIRSGWEIVDPEKLYKETVEWYKN